MPERDTGFYLNRVAQSNPTPEHVQGQSGYFSAPSHSLDPHIFGPDKKLLTDVRAHIINVFDVFMTDAGYHNPSEWTVLYLCGSGASYQWEASRGNGDLDILLGFDLDEFLRRNPDFHGMSEDQLADHINQQLHTGLWPDTAQTNFNGQTYEVTYYLNPGTGTSITNIHPYAAYNLDSDTWAVEPPELPQDPHTMYPTEWYAAASNDRRAAEGFTEKFNAAKSAMEAATPGTGPWSSSATRMSIVSQQASNLFDDLHLGRKEAFKDTGKGYGDWHNFRWQVAKGSGAVDMLHTLANINVEAHKAQALDLYGHEIDSASEALTRAAMWRSKR